MLLLILIMVTGFAGLSYKEPLFAYFLDEQRKEVVPPVHTASSQTKSIKPQQEQTSFTNNRNEKHSIATHVKEDVEKVVIPPIQDEAETAESKKSEKDVALFLDEKASALGLFDLFKDVGGGKNQGIEKISLRLVTFDLAPEYFIMLKKPFRVQRSTPTNGNSTTPLYLLIRQVTEGGAVAVDARGREWLLARDFIMKNWGGKVSWVYIHKEKKESLRKGMDVPEVLKVQKILKEIGYLIEPTGFYNASTFNAIRAFQRDFGIPADGIMGPRTWALLFQMIPQ
jgi:hypothetical protein